MVGDGGEFGRIDLFAGWGDGGGGRELGRIDLFLSWGDGDDGGRGQRGRDIGGRLDDVRDRLGSSIGAMSSAVAPEQDEGQGDEGDQGDSGGDADADFEAGGFHGRDGKAGCGRGFLVVG